jgi:hypothetical protein
VAGTVTRITTGALKGTASAQVSAASSYLQEDFTAVDNLYTSFYLKVTALPTANVRLAVIYDSAGAIQGEVVLLTTGKLRLRHNGTIIGADSTALVANTVYRIGLAQKRGTGTNAVFQAFLATGDAAFSATPFAQSTTGTLTTQATRFRVGATNNSLTAVLDDVRVDSAAMP